MRYPHHRRAQQDDPTGNTEAGPQETAEGDSRRRLEARRAKLIAPLFLSEMDRMDRDLIHYAADEKLDSRSLGMGPPGTVLVSIGRHDTDAGRPGDPQQPTSGTHAGEPAGTAQPPPFATMDADARNGAAADPSPDTQAPPAASPETADTAEEAPCLQASQQPQTETCAVRAPRGTGHTDAGGQGTTCTTNAPPAVLHEERAMGSTDGARLPHYAAAGERVHPGAAISQARAGTHENPPPGASETEEILASIFNAAAPTADQGLQADEPTSPARDPASTSHQAHLRRNYAALGATAETHTTTMGDGEARGQLEGVVSQRPAPQDAPVHGVRAPAETGTVSRPVEGVPPRLTRPWGQESLDYAQSKRDAQRPTAEAGRAAALDLDLWIPRISDVEQLTIQIRPPWIPMDIQHIRTGARTMADVMFNLREGRHSPLPTMEHPGQWRYVATRLMAHMRASTQDDLNRLHWGWHHRAALRIREALIRHNVWTI